MNIEKLLKGVSYTAIHGDMGREVRHLTFDSRTVTEGSCFFAIEGTVVDGHN